MTMNYLSAIETIIQDDVNHRGLRTDPSDNLITRTAGDFPAACRSLAGTSRPAVGIITGFLIPQATPPACETDGPLGAIFLARALTGFGARVVLGSDPSCWSALQAGLYMSGIADQVPNIALLPDEKPYPPFTPADYWQAFSAEAGPLTHLIALERVGPSHTPESIRKQPGAGLEMEAAFRCAVKPDHFNRCHTMRAIDITDQTSPAHLLFDAAVTMTAPPITIGIGDGGNEIGMGKIPWHVIQRNISAGGMIACRVPADFLIVSGISNWGAYGLTAGVAALQGMALDPESFGAERERTILQAMIDCGPLVDGMSGEPILAVDGVDFDRYIEALRKILALQPTALP